MTTMLENARLALKNELFRQDVLWHDGESSSKFMMTRGAVADLDAAIRAVLMAVRDNAPTRAMAESQACGDEGPFLPLLDLLDFSGENARDMVLRAAWCAAIDAILNEPSA